MVIFHTYGKVYPGQTTPYGFSQLDPAWHSGTASLHEQAIGVGAPGKVVMLLKRTPRQSSDIMETCRRISARWCPPSDVTVGL